MKKKLLLIVSLLALFVTFFAPTTVKASPPCFNGRPTLAEKIAALEKLTSADAGLVIYYNGPGGFGVPWVFTGETRVYPGDLTGKAWTITIKSTRGLFGREVTEIAKTWDPFYIPPRR